MRGIHTEVITARGLGPVAVGTTGTGTTGKAVDRRGYRRVEAICSYGTVTATNATITLTLFEGDVTGTMTSVADADLDGTELGASLIAATPRTSDSTKLFTKRIGYKGTKRYVKAKLVSTVTATTPVSVVFVLAEPESAPTSPTQ
jgi:hypothetical protein